MNPTCFLLEEHSPTHVPVCKLSPETQEVQKVVSDSQELQMGWQVSQTFFLGLKIVLPKGQTDTQVLSKRERMLVGEIHAVQMSGLPEHSLQLSLHLTQALELSVIIVV